MVRRFFNSKQAGASLVASVIAIALVSVAAITLGSYVYQIRGGSRKVVSLSSCEQRAAYVLGLFKNNDNKLSTNDTTDVKFHPYWNGSSMVVAPPNYSTGLSRVGAGAPLIGMGAGTSLTLAQGSNSWMLVDSGVNWAAALFNTNGFCGTAQAGGFNGTLITPGTAPWVAGNPLYIPATPAAGPNEQIFLNIEKINFNNGSPSCAIPALPVPIGPTNQGFLPPIANVGMRITVNIQYTGPNGEPQRCQEQTTLKPDGDSIYPAFVDITSSSVEPVSGQCINTGAASSNCVCGAGKNICLSAPCTGGANCIGGYAPLQVNPTKVCVDPLNSTFAMINIGMLSSEPADLALCNLDYNAVSQPTGIPVTMQPCTQFTEGVSGALLRTTSTTQTRLVVNPAKDAATGIIVTATNVPQGYYLFSGQWLDSAQNLSPVVQKRFQVVQTCPLSWTNQYCPGPAPDQCDANMVCTGTMPLTCPPSSSVACSLPVVDICGRSCGPGSGLNLSQCTTSAATTACQVTVNDGCTNVCPMTGIALNPAQCNPSSAPCGAPVYDNCGNICGVTGACPSPATVVVASPPPSVTPAPSPSSTPCTGAGAANCVLVTCPNSSPATTWNAGNCAPAGYTCTTQIGGPVVGPPGVCNTGATSNGNCNVFMCQANSASPTPLPDPGCVPGPGSIVGTQYCQCNNNISGTGTAVYCSNPGAWPSPTPAGPPP